MLNVPRPARRVLTSQRLATIAIGMPLAGIPQAVQSLLNEDFDSVQRTTLPPVQALLQAAWLETAAADKR